MTKDTLFFDPKTKIARKNMDKQAKFEKHNKGIGTIAELLRSLFFSENGGDFVVACN